MNVPSSVPALFVVALLAFALPQPLTAQPEGSGASTLEVPNVAGPRVLFRTWGENQLLPLTCHDGTSWITRTADCLEMGLALGSGLTAAGVEVTFDQIVEVDDGMDGRVVLTTVGEPPTRGWVMAGVEPSDLQIASRTVSTDDEVTEAVIAFFRENSTEADEPIEAASVLDVYETDLNGDGEPDRLYAVSGEFEGSGIVVQLGANGPFILAAEDWCNWVEIQEAAFDIDGDGDAEVAIRWCGETMSSLRVHDWSEVEGLKSVGSIYYGD